MTKMDVQFSEQVGSSMQFNAQSNILFIPKLLIVPFKYLHQIFTFKYLHHSKLWTVGLSLTFGTFLYLMGHVIHLA